MKENLYIPTSGLPWAPAITKAQSVLGMDRLLYAMDYPYHYVPEEVPLTDNFPISAADKKKLFQPNAEKAFKLQRSTLRTLFWNHNVATDSIMPDKSGSVFFDPE
jgi:predicted TIM-barrel fold metal-dependent hydrolase